MIGTVEQDKAKTQKILAEADRIQAQADWVRQHGEMPSIEKPNANGKSQGKKRGRTEKDRNEIGQVDTSKFDEIANGLFYLYQKNWRANQHQRNRFILKSRQVGATWYFAFEAFERAVKEGRNQIFLSASKAQARVFRAYIIAFAIEHFELDLKGGDTIELYKDGKSWATLYFLSTNSATAQSYHGDLYIDEVFWIPNYAKLEAVAKGMASHKKWRRTYFSTPSSIQHPAYKQWHLDNYNKGRKDKVEFNYSNAQLLEGVLGPDNIWRCQVTVVDAQNQGCDLFDIAELRQESTKEVFDNLYMCKFMDDFMSVFPFKELQVCLVDASAWVHIKRDQPRPMGNKPVAIGYDPSRIRDNAALTLFEVPLTDTKPWRMLERHQFHNASSEFQANRIREYLDHYNVSHIGIDITGIGYGVFEQIEDLQQVMPIYYSVDMKTRLIMNTKRISQAKRLQYDSSFSDVTASFMQITQQTTRGGAITYGASRSDKAGHADLAWSAMHAMLIDQDIRGTSGLSSSGGGFVVAGSN